MMPNEPIDRRYPLDWEIVIFPDGRLYTFVPSDNPDEEEIVQVVSTVLQ